MIDCVKVQPHLFVLIWPSELFLGLGVMFKSFFGTYLCRQSTLGLEVQLYLIVLNSAKFGAIFALFRPFEAIFLARWSFFGGWRQVKKHFLESTYVTINFGFISTVLSFCFEFSQNWGHFCTFWAFWVYFWSWDQVQKCSLDLLT